MNYRIAGEKDICQLAELRWIHEYDENISSYVEKEEFIKECSNFLTNGLDAGNWIYWIAVDEDEIIANIYVQKIRKVPKPSKLFAEIAYVTNVHTKEKYRNMGIGTKLLQHVINWAKASEIELLFCWPSERSVPYYERAGFKSQNEIVELLFEED